MRWLRRLAIDVRPLRTHQFRLLWSGAVVSAMGSQFSRVGLYVQVYALTGSPTAVGLLGLSGLVGQPRRRVRGFGVHRSLRPPHDADLDAASGDRCRGVLFFGALSGHPPLWLLHAANLGTWFLAAIHGPARQAAIPRLLSEEEIPAASAFNQAGWQVSSIVGPALAGLADRAVRRRVRVRRGPRLVRLLVRRGLVARADAARRRDRPDAVAWPRSRRVCAISRPSPAAVDVRHRPRGDDLRQPGRRCSR